MESFDVVVECKNRALKIRLVWCSKWETANYETLGSNCTFVRKITSIKFYLINQLRNEFKKVNTDVDKLAFSLSLEM